MVYIFPSRINIVKAGVLVYSTFITFSPVATDAVSDAISLVLDFNITIGNNSFITVDKSREHSQNFCLKIDAYKPGEYSVISNYHLSVYINDTGEMIPPENCFSERVSFLETFKMVH